VIPYKVPNLYDRPWARIWEEYHETGMQRPPEKEIISFKWRQRRRLSASRAARCRRRADRTKSVRTPGRGVPPQGWRARWSSLDLGVNDLAAPNGHHRPYAC